MTWNTITTKVTGNLVTAAEWVDIRENMLFLEEVAFVQFTSNVSVTTTADIDVVSSGAITYEAVPHLIHFQCTRVAVGASGFLRIHLYDGATGLGMIASQPASSGGSVSAFAYLTPTAASHTYKIVADNTASQTSTIVAGAGGVDTDRPGFIRITRVPT